MKRLTALCFLALASISPATVLQVRAPEGRSPGALDSAIEAAVKQFAKNAAILTQGEREALARQGRKPSMFSLPVRVMVDSGNQPPGRGRGPGLNLVFSTVPGRTFPADYQALLQAVFAQAKPRIDATFGDPSLGGDVVVSNYDADIGERDAVAGGVYVYDFGTGGQEIRFPYYADAIGVKPEVTAVNFLHTLLLATIGPKSAPFDAWSEGLARAATMQIARTPGALPATLDRDQIEGVLQSTYDNSTFYDWCNQPALGNPWFIAPNLRSQALPIGGSVGGLYLLRHQMAGSAWQKVLIAAPNFASEFLRRLYVNPGAYATSESLEALGQTALDAATGSPNATVESLPFRSWAERQHALDVDLSPGSKMLVQPFPIASGLGGTDFGVFGIQAHWFETKEDGTENLLRKTAYPIYWSPDFTRFFASAQDDRMDVALGYGSVAPNFPGGAFGNEPYRVSVDVPVEDKVERVRLPAGAVATAANPTPNDFYGTLSGLDDQPGTYKISVVWAGGSLSADVKNWAFGVQSSDSSFLQSQIVDVIVGRFVGSVPTVVMTRRVNKGPGPLALDLVVDGDQTVSLGVPGGMVMLGVPGRPYRPNVPRLIGSSPAQTLAARWNPTRSRYDLYPDFGSVTQGTGFFARRDSAKATQVLVQLSPKTPLSTALKPGWNIVVNPLNEEVGLADVRVIVASDFPRTMTDAVMGGTIGNTAFTFARGAPDPYSGVPETGSLTAATTIQPGQALYIRALNPDGATLLWPTANYRSRDTSTVPSRRWEGFVRLVGAATETEARFGQAEGAKLGIGPEDAELPPSLGGTQVSLRAPLRLYRELRAWGRPDTFTFTLEGLKPGQPYELHVGRAVGTLPRFVLIDGAGGYRKTFDGPTIYRFTATRTSRVVRIMVAKTK